MNGAIYTTAAKQRRVCCINNCINAKFGYIAFFYLNSAWLHNRDSFEIAI
jgi:hypothetical protein